MAESSRRARFNSGAVLALMLPVAALGLCAFQFGDNRGLNSMPFAQVQPLVLDPGKAQKLAKEGNLELLSGQTLRGEEVLVRGELTDANCYLGSHTHAYDHAFCAKLCVAGGAPLVFVPDQGHQIYVVMNERNGIRIPESVLNEIGVPGIVIKGKLLEVDGLKALAIAGLAR
jgi:hypothetical protein